MATALFALLTSLSGSALDDSPAVELRYRGSLSPIVRGDSGEPVKEFSVYALVRKGSHSGRGVNFVVDETGGGGWAWPERFGAVSFNDQNHPTGDTRLQVLYEHDGMPYPLPLHQPLFEHSDRLAPGAEWEADASNYQVIGERTIANRKCWGVEAEDRFGRIRTVWVDRSSPLVVASEHEAVVGRGERFLLEMELESIKAIDNQQLEALDRPLELLLELQQELKRPSGATDAELNERQLAAVVPVLESLQQQAKSTPFEGLAKHIGADVKSQLKRTQNVGDVARKLIGQPAPELQLAALNGKTVEGAPAADGITVLHFWKYRGDPPQEPYGQVGYLDFLYNRWKRSGVHVYGVAVDPRFANASERGAAVRQIRKLTEFMNLSYPIVTDDGTLLSKFGDPRRLGAKLPVWAVIGPDSKIAHYHVGFYEIGRDEGLRELDEIVAGLVKQRRSE